MTDIVSLMTAAITTMMYEKYKKNWTYPSRVTVARINRNADRIWMNLVVLYMELEQGRRITLRAVCRLQLYNIHPNPFSFFNCLPRVLSGKAT